MNSAMTITQWEVDNSNRESAKPAKLSQEKVFNLDNQRRKFYAKNAETANLLRNTSVGIQSKEFLDKFNMTIINNGHIVVKLNSGRKLKVKRMVSDGTFKFYSEAISDGSAIEIPLVVNANPVVNEPVQQVESNVREFPSRTTLQTPEVTRSENVTKETTGIMYDFATRAPVIPARNEVNNNLNNSFENGSSVNTLSRLSRMDYSTNNVSNSLEKNETPVRDNTVSIDDYLQHGKVKNSDRDLASLMENNERLSSEIDESQRVLEQLEAQLAKLKEISEAKRQARISELKEENLSKTATLNGLTEQIRALQEAIKLEQQAANEGTMRRVA